MKNSLFAFVLSTIAMLLISCNESKEAEELYRVANALIDESPHSAIEYLDSIENHLDMTDEAVRNTHALLTIKAKDKAYIPHTTDSAIMSLLPYFATHDEHKSEAYYYAGRVYSDMGDAPQALDYFQKAMDALPEDAETKDVLKRKRLILSQMGSVNLTQTLYAQAKQYFTDALECNTLLGDSASIIVDLLCIGTSYMCENIYDSTLIYYDKAESMSNSYGSEEDKSEVMIQKAKLFCQLQQYEKAWECICATGKVYKDSEVNMYNIGGRICYELGVFDSARFYWNKVIDQGSINALPEAYAGLANIAIEKKEDNIVEYLNKCANSLDSLRRYEQIESVANIQHLYNYQHKEKEIAQLAKEASNRNMLIQILCGLIVGAVLVAIIIYRQYHLKLLQSDLQAIRYRQLEETLSKYATKEKNPAESFSQKKVFTSKAIAYLNDKITKEIILTSNEWEMVQNILNQECPNFIPRLNELRLLNETEMHICMLLKVGISPSNIAVLIGRDRSTVTVTRKRLFKKVFGVEGTSSKWDEYILSL